MRILLQRTDSSLYFKDLGSWTASSSEAMDFVSSTAALDFCAANNLVGVQVVLRFDEEKHEIVFPPMPPQVWQGQRPTESA